MELSPQREDEVVVQILRDQVGIDARSLRAVLRLAALGLVNSAWRNTCVEDWHAEGRLHDGDMLGISSHMSWRLDQLLWRWRSQMGIAPDAQAHSLDEISFDDFRWLGGRIYQWIVNPSRRLPTGVTLRDVARENLPQLENDADEALTAFVYQAEDRGVGFAFRRAAAHGGLACRHWWGHPAWPELVDRFIRALDDPGDPHWGDNGEFRVRLPAEPAAVQDRNSLRRTLLQQLWTLDFGSAQWIVAAGIGYLRNQWPTMTVALPRGTRPILAAVQDMSGSISPEAVVWTRRSRRSWQEQSLTGRQSLSHMSRHNHPHPAGAPADRGAARESQGVVHSSVGTYSSPSSPDRSWSSASASLLSA